MESLVCWQFHEKQIKNMGRKELLIHQFQRMQLQELQWAHHYVDQSQLWFIPEWTLCYMQWIQLLIKQPWSYMFGGKSNPQVTIRSIINRGEQGAQHSQSLHSLFAHIPGLRVVMPYSVQDARDLLIASVLSKDPVIFIDDRWLYEDEAFVSDIQLLDLSKEKSKTIIQGNDLTIVSSSYSTKIAKKAIELFQTKSDKTIELIDIRIINPIDTSSIVNSVKKTKRLIVVDGGWKNCGLGSSIISSVCEEIEPCLMKVSQLTFL